MVDTAIFLGAGASKAEGAPSQDELFANYFTSDVFKTARTAWTESWRRSFSRCFRSTWTTMISPILGSQHLKKYLG